MTTQIIQNIMNTNIKLFFLFVGFAFFPACLPIVIQTQLITLPSAPSTLGSHLEKDEFVFSGGVSSQTAEGETTAPDPDEEFPEGVLIPRDQWNFQLRYGMSTNFEMSFYGRFTSTKNFYPSVGGIFISPKYARSRELGLGFRSTLASNHNISWSLLYHIGVESLGQFNWTCEDYFFDDENCDRRSDFSFSETDHRNTMSYGFGSGFHIPLSEYVSIDPFVMLQSIPNNDNRSSFHLEKVFMYGSAIEIQVEPFEVSLIGYHPILFEDTLQLSPMISLQLGFRFPPPLQPEPPPEPPPEATY